MSKCSLSMSDLCISCDSVVNGRHHAVSCDVCERWQFGSVACVVQDKQYSLSPMVKLFQANETFSGQYINMSKWITKLWQHFSWK